MTSRRSVLHDVGQILLGSIFTCGGLLNLTRLGHSADTVREAGLPAPKLLARTDATIMLICGTALAVGIKPKPAAAALAAVLVPTTIVGHAFWKKEGMAQVYEMENFTKDIALVGALLVVATRPDASPNASRHRRGE